VTDLRPHILLADDEESVIDLLCLILGNYYSISSVRSGTEAHALLMAYGSSYCAAVIDSCMPGMEGENAVRLAREAGVKTPAIICSGMSYRKSVDLPANTWFINKPFKKDELIDMLRNIRRIPQ